MKPSINFTVLFMTMLMRSPTAVSLVETNGKWIWSSDRYTQLFGPNNSNLSFEDKKRIRRLVKDTADWLDDVKPVALSVVADDGVRRVLTVTAENMLVDKDFRGVCLYAKDTTKQYEIENKRALTELYLKSLLENTDSGILLMDTEFTILYVNNYFTSLFQVSISPHEAEGRPATSLQELAANPFADQYDAETKGYAILGGSLEGWNETFPLVSGSIVLRTYIPIYRNNKVVAHMWQFNDVTMEVNE